MKNILIYLSFILLFSCSDSVHPIKDGQLNISRYGQDKTFEIATWNIQNFPKIYKTSDLVKTIIDSIDVDLIAVQEIASVSDFNALVNSLSGWKGALSGDSYQDGSYQKTGLLYKSSFISISSVRNIFNDDSDAFPRPPLTAYVQIKDFDSTKYDFNIIVLHLKASGFGNEADNIRRRKAACIKLESYISTEIQAGADADFIVLGDWNDELNDDGGDNVFMPFLNKDTLYSFLTYNLTDASYPSYNSLIDHILISAESFAEYNSGITNVLKLDQAMANYTDDVSDHRPVVARFDGFSINISN